MKEHSQGHGQDLTSGSVPHLLLKFSLPMLAGSSLQTAYSIVNAVWVGKFLGENELAAVTVSFPVVFVLIAAAMGLTVAANILVAQNYGAKDRSAVRRVVTTATTMIAALSLIVVALGEILLSAILGIMDTPQEVFQIARDYLRISLLTIPLTFGMFLTRSFLQGIGNSTTPLYFLAGSVTLTAILDPILMLGWLGFPRLGLNGTAWAMLIAQSVALITLIWTLRASNSLVTPAFSLAGFDRSTMLTILRIGLPSAFQQALISLNMVVMTALVNGFGKNATAAFGAASRIDQVAFLPAMTFSMAIATMSGQNIGAQKYDRIRNIFRWGCLLTGSFTLAASFLVLGFPGWLLSAFTNDSAVLDIGIDYLQIVGCSYIFFAIMFVSHGIINGAGHTIITASITVMTLWLFRVPLATWLVNQGAGLRGIWYAMGFSFGLAMVGSLSYYFSGRWRRPILRKLPPITDRAAEVFGEETGVG